MVDEVIKKQELIDAQKDAQSLDDFINGGDQQVVVTRLLKAYPTLANAIRQIYEKGGKFYPTLAQANADIANIRTDVYVITGDSGAYYKATSGATTLTKSAYDPLTQAKVDFRNNGFARLILAKSGAIDYNTKTRELTFSGTIWIVTNSGTQALNTPQVLVLTNVSPYRIEYDQSANTLYRVPYNQAKVDGRIVLGSAAGLASGIETEGFVSTTNGMVKYQSEIGELRNSVATRINFDNTAGKLSIHPLVRIKSPTYSSTVGGGTNTEVNYPTSNGTRKLRFNTINKTFQFSALDSVAPTSNIELATVAFYGGVATSVEGLRVYAIDGSTPSVATTPQNFTATMAASDPSSINFNFESGQLEIEGAKVRINYEKTSILLPSTTVPFVETGGANYWQKFIYNKETKVFSAKLFSSSLADNELVFALIQPSTKSVFGIPDYYVDGKPIKYTLRLAPRLATYGDLRPLYVQPTLPEFKTALDSFGSDFTKIYDLYDALVAEHPSYVTKSLMGVDGFGNQMFSYQFSTAEVETETHGNKKNKYIIFSGIHGGEKGGIYNTYNAMKQICERATEDTHLAALKHGVKFIVVPICSPSSYQLNTRQNGNGVDIARNFPTGWFLGDDPSSGTYGGATPMDQVETQLLVALMEQHKDALCFATHHNFTTQARLLWISARSFAQVNMYKSLIIGESMKAKKQFSWIDQSDNSYLGYVDIGDPGAGMEASHAFAMGMYANTVEVGMVVPEELGTPVYSSAFATLACQFFINYLLSTVDDAVKFHNSKIAYYDYHL